MRSVLAHFLVKNQNHLNKATGLICYILGITSKNDVPCQCLLLFAVVFNLTPSLRLKANGIHCKSSIGSTPSCSHPIPDMALLDEVHPGNYVFYGESKMAKFWKSADPNK